jgi:hypothetical protein
MAKNQLLAAIENRQQRNFGEIHYVLNCCTYVEREKGQYIEEGLLQWEGGWEGGRAGGGSGMGGLEAALSEK